MKIGKQDIIRQIRNRLYLNKEPATNIYNTFFDILTEELKKGNTISLYGFISLKPHLRLSRKYYDIKTKKHMYTTDSNTIKLSVCKSFKNKINEVKKS